MTSQTPYDTGERLEPKPWVQQTLASGWITGTDNPRPSVQEDFGRVDFDDEEGTSIVAVHAERVENGHYELRVYAYGTAPVTVVEESGEDPSGIREALDKYLKEAFRSANLAADATDVDDVLQAEMIIEDAREQFAPLAARWIATRLGVDLG